MLASDFFDTFHSFYQKTLLSDSAIYGQMCPINKTKPADKPNQEKILQFYSITKTIKAGKLLVCAQYRKKALHCYVNNSRIFRQQICD